MPRSSDLKPAHSDVIVVGSYVHDHVWLTERFPNTGETLGATGFATGPGGKGFNQAIACKRQDAAVTFVGSIGADHLGAAAREFALAEGLDCRWQVRDDVPTAAASIAVDAIGANRILVNYAANLHLDPAFVEAQSELFESARVVLVQLESNLDAVRAALDLGAKHGLLRLLNPAPVHRDIDTALLARCDLITPNESEFALLLERVAVEHIRSDDVATLDDEHLHTLCRSLAVPTIIITLGAAGCFVSHGDARRGDAVAHYRIAAEPARTIDTVGAGDAFNGALAAALAGLSSRPFRDAVMRANRVAALSTEKIGAAIAMPTRAEVDARFGS